MSTGWEFKDNEINRKIREYAMIFKGLNSLEIILCILFLIPDNAKLRIIY